MTKGRWIFLFAGLALAAVSALSAAPSDTVTPTAPVCNGCDAAYCENFDALPLNATPPAWSYQAQAGGSVSPSEAGAMPGRYLSLQVDANDHWISAKLDDPSTQALTDTSLRVRSILGHHLLLARVHNGIGGWWNGGGWIANGYVFQVSAWDGVWIHKMSGGVWTQLIHLALPAGLSPGQPVDLRFDAVGSQLTGYINGTAVITFSDAEHASGTVGLGSLGGTPYDDLKVNPVDCYTATPSPTLTDTPTATVSATPSPTPTLTAVVCPLCGDFDGIHGFNNHNLDVENGGAGLGSGSWSGNAGAAPVYIQEASGWDLSGFTARGPRGEGKLTFDSARLDPSAAYLSLWFQVSSAAPASEMVLLDLERDGRKVRLSVFGPGHPDYGRLKVVFSTPGGNQTGTVPWDYGSGSYDDTSVGGGAFSPARWALGVSMQDCQLVLQPGYYAPGTKAQAAAPLSWTLSKYGVSPAVTGSYLAFGNDVQLGAPLDGYLDDLRVYRCPGWATPVPTATLTLTETPSLTPTPTSTATLTASPTPLCQILAEYRGDSDHTRPGNSKPGQIGYNSGQLLDSGPSHLDLQLLGGPVRNPSDAEPPQGDRWLASDLAQNNSSLIVPNAAVPAHQGCVTFYLREIDPCPNLQVYLGMLGSSNRIIEMFRDASQPSVFNVNTGGSKYLHGSLQPGVTQQVGICWGPSGVTLYRDGVAIDQDPQPLDFGSVTAAQIGADFNGFGPIGSCTLIDDVTFLQGSCEPLPLLTATSTPALSYSVTPSFTPTYTATFTVTYTPTPSPSGTWAPELRAWYRGDSDGQLLDSSGNHRDLTLEGAGSPPNPSSPQPLQGDRWLVSGEQESNSRLLAPASVLPASDGCVEFTLLYSAPTSSGVFLYYALGPQGELYALTNGSNQPITFGVANVTARVPGPGVGQAVRFGVCWNADGLKVYSDGVLVAQSAGVPIFVPGSNPLRIGSAFPGSRAIDANTLIDDFKVWGGSGHVPQVPTATVTPSLTLTATPSSTPTPLCQLLAEYRGDSSGQFLDSGPNGYTLQHAGGAIRNPSDAEPPQGDRWLATDLAQNGGKLIVPNAAVPAHQGCVTFYLREIDPCPDLQVYLGLIGSSNRLVEMFRDPSQPSVLNVNTNGSKMLLGSLQPGVTQEVGVCWGPGGTTLYRDGVAIDHDPMPMDFGSVTSAHIGADFDGSWPIGNLSLIDDVTFTQGSCEPLPVLTGTATPVLAYTRTSTFTPTYTPTFTSTFTPTPSPSGTWAPELRAWYRGDSDGQLLDSSGKHRDLTLEGVGAPPNPSSPQPLQGDRWLVAGELESNSRLLAPAAVLPVSDGCIEFTLLYTGPSGAQAFLYYALGPNGEIFASANGPSQGIHFVVANLSADVPAPAIGQAARYSVCWNADGLKVYRDGLLAAHSAGVPNFVSDGSPFRIGNAYGGAAPIDAHTLIDDVKVWGGSGYVPQPPTATVTPSWTASASPSATPSATPSASPSATPSMTPTLSSTATPVGSGLSGQYQYHQGGVFNGSWIAAGCRVDPTLWFDWGAQGPGGGAVMDSSAYSSWYQAAWSGSIDVPVSGDYTFKFAGSMGADVSIDGVRVFSVGTGSYTLPVLGLSAGWHSFSVFTAYLTPSGQPVNGFLHLSWSGPGLAEQPLGAPYLAPAQNCPIWVAPTPTPTPTVTATATASDSPSATPSATPTGSPTATPSVTATPSSSATVTVSDSPTATPSVTATATPSSTGTATASDSPTATPSATATGSPTATPSVTPSGTGTATLSASPTATSSATGSATPTGTPTATPTSTPSSTGTGTATATPSGTASATNTTTPTATPSITASTTSTASPTATPSGTASATKTATPTATPSATASATGTASTTGTPSRTRSATATATPTATRSATATASPSATPTATRSATSSSTTSPSVTPTANVPTLPGGGGGTSIALGGLVVNSNVTQDAYNSCAGAYGTGPVTAPAPVPTPAVTPTPFPLPVGLPNLGTLTVNSGKTITLAAGDYNYSNIYVNPSGKLLTSGPVRLWFSGQFIINANASAAPGSGKPADLWVFGGAGGGQFIVNAAGSFTGVVYAPKSQVIVNSGASLFGAVVGAQVVLNSNAQVHYDLGLAGCPAAPATAAHVGLARLEGGPKDVALPSGPRLIAGPNPAGERVLMQVELAVAAEARVRAYNVLGEPVNVLTLGPLPAGRHQAWMDLRQLASGIYLLVLESDEGSGWAKRGIFKLAVKK